MPTVAKHPTFGPIRRAQPDTLEGWLEDPPEGTEWIQPTPAEQRIQQVFHEHWLEYQRIAIRQGWDIATLEVCPVRVTPVGERDIAEFVFQQADADLNAGDQEIWLVLPNSKRVIVVTAEGDRTFKPGEIVQSQAALPNFEVPVDELLN